jgi:hypothetical protein
MQYIKQHMEHANGIDEIGYVYTQDSPKAATREQRGKCDRRRMEISAKWQVTGKASFLFMRIRHNCFTCLQKMLQTENFKKKNIQRL